MKSDKIVLAFSHFGKTDYDKVRRQKIRHLVYRKCDGDVITDDYVEVLEYEDFWWSFD